MRDGIIDNDISGVIDEVSERNPRYKQRPFFYPRIKEHTYNDVVAGRQI